MSRVKPFILAVKVSGELLCDDYLATKALAHDVLLDKADDDLVGPRGGRYVPINQPYGFDHGQTADDFLRNEWTFTARITGRYVRPSPTNEDSR